MRTVGRITNALSGGRYPLGLDAEVQSAHLAGVVSEGDTHRVGILVVTSRRDVRVAAEGLVRFRVSEAVKLLEQWPAWRESTSQPLMVNVQLRSQGQLAWVAVDDLRIPVPLRDDWHTVPDVENIRRTSGPASTQRTHLWGGVHTAWKIHKMMGDRAIHGPLLDWGVGAGRVAVPLKRLFRPDEEIVGVDVDTVNVGWCSQNLSDIAVSLSQLYPPIAFPDDHFGAVYGVSVMTHLTRQAQAAWLQEIRRVLRPGGLAILTVHGDHSLLQRHLSERVIRGIREDGISDVEQDDVITLSEPGYYRGTFQLRAQVHDAWSPIMPIVAYLPTANAARQDYVLLRKP
jgi:SAM-dependent methyltransferase